MPVQDKHKMLLSLLDTLLEEFNIRSWQIYSENQGCCLKIRMSQVQHEEEKINASTVEHQKIETTKFKKVSKSTLKRDKERSSAYHSRVMTRSRSKNQDKTPETAREATATEDKVDISPISVCETSVSCTRPLDDSVCINLDNSLTENRSVHSCESLTPLKDSDQEILGQTSEELKTVKNFHFESDSETSDPPVGDFESVASIKCSCQTYQCQNAKDPSESRSKYYICSICNIRICDLCYNACFHYGHTMSMVYHNEYECT